MKPMLLALAILALSTQPTVAQRQWLETTDEARQRHNAERWDQYQERRSQGRDWAPLGGYQEQLGDPTPKGTERPGYTAPRRDAYGNRRGRYQ